MARADVDAEGSEACAPFASGQTEPIALEGRGDYEADVDDEGAGLVGD